MSARINFTHYIETQHRDGDVIIEMPDGDDIVIPPSVLWPAPVLPAIRDQDETGAMRAILGDDQYERFIAAGGTWAMFNDMYTQGKGVDVGEAPASPTD